MKASVKVRDGQKPLVRARVPVSLFGFPLFSAISLGHPEELALHLGSCVEEGPLFKVTYKPNDLLSPCSLLLKTGVGIWGSPASAALAMAAEFSLSSKMSPSFMLRVKPRIGDFSLSKDARHWNAGAIRKEAKSARHQQELAAVEPHAWTVGSSINGITAEIQPQDDSTATEHFSLRVPDGSQGRTSIAVKRCEMGVVNGRNGYLDNATVAQKSPGESSDSFGQSTLDRAKSFGSVVSHLESSRSISGDLHTQRSVDGSPDSELSDESCVFVTGFEEREPGLDVPGVRAELLPAGTVREEFQPPEKTKLFQRASGALSVCNSWCLRAHSSLPIGKLAVLSVRWNVKVPPDMCEGTFAFAKLPVLGMDKITLESTGPCKRRLLVPNHGENVFRDDYATGLPSDNKDELLHRMTGMFSSMRHQIYQLHAENRSFKRALEELKVEVGCRGGSLVRFRGQSPGDLLMQEENMLRSQLFDEMQAKTKDARVSSSSKREADVKHEVRGKKDKELWSDPKTFESSSASVFGQPGSTNPGQSSLSESEVSEELKRAIMNATNAGR